jgi:hypothetical protein
MLRGALCRRAVVLCEFVEMAGACPPNPLSSARVRARFGEELFRLDFLPVLRRRAGLFLLSFAFFIGNASTR